MVMRHASWRLVLLPGALGLGACGSAGSDTGGPGGFGGQPTGAEWSIEFKLTSGADEVRCGGPWQVGANGPEAELRAFAFYVHDLAIIKERGRTEALDLVPDAGFQANGVALLDFDDGAGRCASGTPETHTALRIRGTKPEDIVGLSFMLGVPGRLNHLDLSAAEAPLNQPEMYWSWQGGYKYLRLELESPGNPKGYLVHVGSMECEGSPALGYSCGADNLARMELTGDLREGVFVDVGALLSRVDVDARPDGVADAVAGCMSNPTDPECAPIYGALGLPFGAEPAPTEDQRVFRLP